MCLYKVLPWKLISMLTFCSLCYLDMYLYHFVTTCNIKTWISISNLFPYMFYALYTKFGIKKTWGLCLMMKQGFILKIHRAFPSSKLSAHDLHTFSSGNINHRESWHVYYIHSCLLDSCLLHLLNNLLI